MQSIVRLSILAALAVLLSAGSARADWCYAPYHHYGIEHVPYYALHPPVYYSYPVPRTYGYSPFAYPPGTMTPELQIREVKPKVIENPHVPQAEKTSTDRTAAARPKVIVNPYFNDPIRDEVVPVSSKNAK
ncbi:MAG: hypothetical protein HYS13_23070 [Planctomycetia bacterium]|nr:hypothetical protein [Planctomycetia bacterium]